MKITAAIPNAEVNEQARTITGVATFYGQAANASTGRVRFEPGSLVIPDDISRVKLCIEHDHTSAIGYATAWSEDGNQLTMTFYIPQTPQGDAALASAAAGLRDGLSVGAYPEPDGYQYINGQDLMRITKATVREVSLTAIPAFTDAKVTDITATTATDEQETTMTTLTPTDATTDVTEAQAPPILTQTGRALDVRAAAESVADIITSGGDARDIKAALSDVLQADDKGTGFIGRPTWLGELWKARRVERPLIDSITRKPLGRTTKVKGWQWDKRPQVGAYAGDKTEIPSNKVSTKLLEADVQRIAGGWDIDRIYIDLGDPAIIEALWEGAVEDYAVKTEAAALATLTQAATPLTAPHALPGALVQLGTAAAKTGAHINFVGFGVDVWTAFSALTRDEIPWWMTSGDTLNLSTTSASVNGLRLFVDQSLPAGTILAGDKRAATWFEDQTPIRVNAVDLPRGGIDLGLFGYYGLLVNDPASLFKIEAPKGN